MSSQIFSLRWRLLLAYLVAMASILVTFTTALYIFHVELVVAEIIALILSSASAVYLTQLALESIDQNTQRLKKLSADASHELRNPLTALCTAVELMQSHSEQFNPSDVKKLAIVASASEQIGRLVEDLLFLVRSDAVISFPVASELFKPTTNGEQSTVNSSHHSGAAGIDITPPCNLEQPPIPLDELLEDLVERLEPQVQNKGINFESHLASGICIKGDTNLLIRLFSNLLENAIKYTDKGGIAILSLDQDRRFAIVSFDNTGLGIPTENPPLVFPHLWRVDKGQSQQKQSYGLGLAIAEVIVQQHHGKIKVSSKDGVGRCFQVYLPLASS